MELVWPHPNIRLFLDRLPEFSVFNSGLSSFLEFSPKINSKGSSSFLFSLSLIPSPFLPPGIVLGIIRNSIISSVNSRKQHKTSNIVIVSYRSLRPPRSFVHEQTAPEWRQNLIEFPKSSPQARIQKYVKTFSTIILLLRLILFLVNIECRKIPKISMLIAKPTMRTAKLARRIGLFWLKYSLDWDDGHLLIWLRSIRVRIWDVAAIKKMMSWQMRTMRVRTKAGRRLFQLIIIIMQSDVKL